MDTADGAHKIWRAAECLAKQKERIEELEGLLKSAKEKYARLEHQLTLAQSEASPACISYLPTEILAMVFKFFLCNNETHIRHLLLVCKRWHNLAMSRPDMWTTIRIEIPEDCWDISSWVESISPFVVKCVETSHPALLDITVNLSGLCYDQEKVLIGRLRAALDPGYDVETLLRCLRDGERYLVDYEDEPVCFDEEILTLLEDLTGPNGKFMVRWGSFELAFPREDELARQILGCMVHPTPNLTSLCLWLDDLENVPHVFPDLSRLQKLYIDDVPNWDFLSLAPSSLRHIQVQTHIENRPALQLSRFFNLTSLQIHCEDMDWSDLPSDAGPMCITLPKLRELTLTAPFEHLTRSEFNLPALKHLFLVCSYNDSPKQLPGFYPIFLCWTLCPRPGEGRSSARVKSILQELLSHFTTAVNLAVPVSQRLILLDLLMKMSAEGTLPRNWETVSFQSEEEIAEMVVIHEHLKAVVIQEHLEAS